jgi:D-alanyl-D-alanine carboxypeptidase (penicillin-binding protein 5/6)
MARRAALCLALTIVATVMAGGPARSQEGFTTAARSFLMVDHETGQSLAAVEPDQRMIPASLVKIMTLKLAFEALEAGRLRLEETTVVSEKAWRTPGSTMFLLVDTQVTVEDLIQGIAIVSGNDACVALAELLAGSEAAFVELMNRRAADLGLSNTRFVDSHGLSPDNYTTARDVTTLVRRYISDHPDVLALHSTRSFTYTPPGDKPIRQFNRNLLLGRFEGTDGLKTGYLRESGYNMVATAQRDGMRLIAVLLGIPGEIGPEGEETRARETIAALNYGFRNFTTVRLAEAGTPLRGARVWKGTADQTTIGPREPVVVTAPRGFENALDQEVTFARDLIAPVRQGTVVGELVVAARGQELRRFELVALTDVPRAGLGKVIIDTIRLWFARLFGRVQT